MLQEYNPYFNPFFGSPIFIPPNCSKPPTIYAILESIVNGDKNFFEDDEIKIKDLAKYGRETIFNFDYPLSDRISKEKFETMILNHYLMRRIGFETVTAFRIQLDVKLNEIMPLYNKMFDAIDNWNIFVDGETITKTGEKISNINTTNENSNEVNTESETIATSNNETKDSELPQSKLNNVRDNKYLTNFKVAEDINTGKDKSTSNGTSRGVAQTNDNNNYTETIRKEPDNKVEILKEIQTNIKSIYSMIFDELDSLFYGLV